MCCLPVYLMSFAAGTQWQPDIRRSSAPHSLPQYHFTKPERKQDQGHRDVEAAEGAERVEESRPLQLRSDERGELQRQSVRSSRRSRLPRRVSLPLTIHSWDCVASKKVFSSQLRPKRNKRAGRWWWWRWPWRRCRSVCGYDAGLAQLQEQCLNTTVLTLFKGVLVKPR